MNWKECMSPAFDMDFLKYTLQSILLIQWQRECCLSWKKMSHSSAAEQTHSQSPQRKTQYCVDRAQKGPVINKNELRVERDILYHMSNSRECIGANGEALQLHAVYKKPYFLLQVTWESVSVLQVMRESVSVLQVTWKSVSGTYNTTVSFKALIWLVGLELI